MDALGLQHEDPVGLGNSVRPTLLRGRQHLAAASALIVW